MRVTFLMAPPGEQPNGHFQMHYTYANELAAMGHEVTIVTCLTEKMVGFLLPADEEFWFRFRPEVRRILMAPCISELPTGDAIIEIVNFVHHSQLCAPELGVNFAFANGYAELCTPDEQHRIWRYAGWKMANARWLRRLAVRHGIPFWQTAHVPNGVDGSTFRVVTPIERRARRVAAHLTRFPLKGGTDAIQAIALARAERPDLEAVVFGRAPRPPELPEWCEYYQTPTRSVLVEEVYNRASIFLCAGIREGFNNPSLEAMSCGCAVVGTTMGALTEYAKHDENALLSPIRDPRGLAEHLVQLLDDPERCIRLAVQGTTTAQRRPWRRSAAVLERVLETRVEASRRAGTDPRRLAIEGADLAGLERALADVLRERSSLPLREST